MNEMTDEQINQAVAECCGINDEWLMKRYDLNAVTLAAFDRNKLLPDFANSRDAMAGALEKLSEQEWDSYCYHLHKICGLRELDYDDDHSAEEMRPLLCATARQQAEAFLKAKGKL